MRTSEPGIFIRKIPRVKDEPAHLAVEINPIGKSGNPMYRVGSLIKDKDELDAIRALLSLEKVDELLETVEKLSHQQAD